MISVKKRQIDKKLKQIIRKKIEVTIYWLKVNKNINKILKVNK